MIMPGWQELLFLAVVILLIFGAKRLPEIGKSLGTGLREFKKSVTGEGDNEALEDKSQSATPSSTTESSQAEKK